MKRCSELTFKDIFDSKFGGFLKVIWNGSVIYSDMDNGLVISGKNGKKVKISASEAITYLEEKYGPKKIYTFYCRVVAFHHTELYIEGEK